MTSPGVVVAAPKVVHTLSIGPTLGGVTDRFLSVTDSNPQFAGS